MIDLAVCGSVLGFHGMGGMEDWKDGLEKLAGVLAEFSMETAQALTNIAQRLDELAKRIDELERIHRP